MAGLSPHAQSFSAKYILSYVLCFAKKICTLDDNIIF